jgi:radical SAM protein with 4Fe4S-binding SPASM domain
LGLEIKLTDRCNLACEYCYYRKAKHHPDLSFTDVKKVIDYFSETMIPKGGAEYPITFFGGEPLLKKGIILKVVDHYQNRPSHQPLKFNICTNGVLLTPPLLAEFRQRSIDIYLSLDGAQEVQDTHRVFPDGRGSFEMLLDNLPLYGEHCQAVEQVITPQTAGKLLESFLFLVGHGFERIYAIPDFTHHWTPELLNLLVDQYQKIAEYKKAHPGIHFSILDDKISLLQSGLSYKHFSCNFGRHSYVVGTDRHIYPCTRFAQDIQDNRWSIGHIDKGIDQGKRRRLFLGHQKDRTECANCSLKNFCLGNNCACIAFSLAKDIQHVSPLVCEHERKVFELIGKTYKES